MSLDIYVSTKDEYSEFQIGSRVVSQSVFFFNIRTILERYLSYSYFKIGLEFENMLCPLLGIFEISVLESRRRGFRGNQLHFTSIY